MEEVVKRQKEQEWAQYRLQAMVQGLNFYRIYKLQGYTKVLLLNLITIGNLKRFFILLNEAPFKVFRFFGINEYDRLYFVVAL